MRCLVHLIVGAIGFGFGCNKVDGSYGLSVSDASVAQTQADKPATSNEKEWSQPAYLDLPAQQLSHRVNGAEPKLQALGCRRLRVWRLSELSAEIELYDFATEQGAKSLLAERVGTDRSGNVPGNEGWLGKNVLYFRRGSSFVALIADRVTSPETLRSVARDFEGALLEGKVQP